MNCVTKEPQGVGHEGGSTPAHFGVHHVNLGAVDIVAGSLEATTHGTQDAPKPLTDEAFLRYLEISWMFFQFINPRGQHVSTQSQC